MPSSLHVATITLILSTLSVVPTNAQVTWPNPEYDALDELLYGIFTDSFVNGCELGLNNKSVNAEWLRFAYHDAATHNVVNGTGGVDASLLFELDRPENPGQGMVESATEFLEFSNKYITRSDAVAAAAIVAVVACNGPVIDFRPGRIDANEACPPDQHVPEPQDTLESQTESFNQQGFNPSEMIALVACGHTMGGVRNPDFPQLVPPAANREDNIISFDSTPAFDNMVVTQYLNSTTPNVLVISPNTTMTSDLRIFSSDNNETMIGLMSPSNFSSTCGSLLERLFNNVPSEVTLGDPLTPLEAKILNLAIVPTTQGTFNMSLNLRLLNPPDENATVSLLWDNADGSDCPSCISPARMSFSFPIHTSMFSALGYSPFLYDMVATNMSAFTKFWFEIDLNDGSNVTTIDNGGAGYPVTQDVLFMPAKTLPPVTDPNGRRDTRNNITVAVATPNGTTPTSVTAYAFLRSPVNSSTPNIPSAPLNESLTFTQNTWSNLPLPGYELYTVTPHLVTGDFAVDVTVVLSDGSTYYHNDILFDS